MAETLPVSAPVPTSFDSVPVLNPLNATFYYFTGERGEQDIDELWVLFASALHYADNPTEEHKAEVSRLFDLAIGKKGNGNSKITMALYWIAPDAFLNLDSRNEWYIYQSGKIPASVVQSLPAVETKISAEMYFEIAEKLKAYLESGSSKLKNFRELSYEAWVLSQKVNDEEKAQKAQAEKKPKGAAVADDNVETVHYWMFSPGDGAASWEEFYDAGIMAIGWDEIGDLSVFPSKDAMKRRMKECYDASKSYKNSAHATWQFVHDLKPGDIVFAKKGMHLIVGKGVVEAEYEFDAARSHYKNVRKVNWTHKGEWASPSQGPMKTLTDVTPYTEYVEKVKALFVDMEEEEDTEEQERTYPAYGREKFLSQVYMDETSYDTLVGLLNYKKNVILQGPPGVGKTYAAKRLAYSMMGVRDPNRVMMVQFHQSYSYEDFIMGFRPSETGFELRKGVFYNFCKMAEEDSENDYFFIIDEINRGNLSKIFGELFMLIENDKRDIPLQLLYSNEKFSVPGNVYLIGMMNTADRSLAMLDYALRRRFAFYEMKPGFDTDGFRAYQTALDNAKFDRLISCVERLNEAIAADDSLGEGFCIGHSYFCGFDEKPLTDQALFCVVEYELIPLLKEYWFDEPAKVRDWSGNLRSAIQ